MRSFRFGPSGGISGAAALSLVVILGCSREPALPRQFSVLSGDQIRQSLISQKGKVVVLNFWATWCVPCREEFPALVNLDKTHRDEGVRVFGISVDDIEDIDGKVKPFIKGIGATFPVWVKAAGDPMRFMEAISPQISGAIPETLIYDRDGNLVGVLAGQQTYDEFEDAIRPLL